MLRLIKLCSLLFFLSLSSVCEAKPKCDDFLDSWQIKPEELQFISCQEASKAPTTGLLATYSVEGSQAKAIEDMLHAEFAMERLRFVCCGWETRPAFYEDAEGVLYEINMHSSGEFQGSFKWEDFPEFRVSVYRYITLP